MNEALAQWLFNASFKNSFLDFFIIFFSNYFPYLIGLGFLTFLAVKERGRKRLFILLETTLTILLSRGILTEAIRFFHPVARPFQVWQVTPLVHETLNTSFPSGHATFFFALATTLLFYNRTWGSWFLLFAIMNGIARVTAGVHWPLDIVGGAGIGIVSSLVINLLLHNSWKMLTYKTDSLSKKELM